jgi:predicted aspartyl protease
MPMYDVENFSPPAPVASVTLRHPTTGASLSGVLLLMDSGADVTLLPRQAIEALEITPLAEIRYEVQGFDGSTQVAQAVSLELLFLEKQFTGQFLLIDEPFGILGRNVMNALKLVFDGPRQTWEELKSV